MEALWWAVMFGSLVALVLVIWWAIGDSTKKRRFRRSVELQRTCQRCGTVWHLSFAEANQLPPNKMMMFGQRMSSAGEGLSVGSQFRGREFQKLQALEGKKAAIEARSRCPSCGSQAFTQQYVQL